MRKNEKEKLRQKEMAELTKEAQKLRQDIAKAQLDAVTNAQKNTNAVSNMKKRLAVTLTVLSERVQTQ